MRSDLEDPEEGWLVSDRAAEWFVRLRDHATPGQRRDYWRWLKKSQEHVAAALDTGRVYGLLREMKLPPGISDPPTSAKVVPLFRDQREKWRTVEPKPERPSERSWKNVAMWLIGVLASVMTVVTAIAWFDGATQTVAGEWRVQVLADGSMVRMGPRSRMRVEFDDQRRYVRLLAGDAMFEVAKDSQRPFIVDSGFGTATAVGTEFGVSRYENRMVVTVAEGVVAVAHSSNESTRTRTAAHSLGAQKDLDEVSVTAGQQVAVARARGLPVRQVDVEQELAWVRGKLIFENQTIGDAVAEFNRRNRVQIEVLDNAIASRPLWGVFDAGDPRSFVEFLEMVGPIRVTQDRANVLRLEPSSTSEGHETAPLQSNAR
jgi:transmembrane sensor